MESYKEMWALVCEELKRNLNEVVFNVWFESIEIIDFDGTSIVLGASEFKRNTIQRQFYAVLEDALKTVLGFVPEITFVDPEKKIEESEEKQEFTVASTDLNTFENFVVGSSNRFAYTAAKAVAEEPVVTYNPLFIWGSSGLGKTHLLCAIRNTILKRNPDANIVFTRGEDFVNLIIDGIKEKNMNAIHDKFRNCDVLLVDDIQFIAGKQSTQEEFFHTFNTLTADGKQIVLISDSTPKDIALLDERLRTRFEQGLIADIQAPDFETRVAIVRSKAKMLGIDMPEEVTEYIAEKVKSSIRQLEGAVKKLYAYVSLEGSAINIAMAQNAIRDLAGNGIPIAEIVNKIIGETARTFGVAQAEITSKKKDQKTAKARQVAIYAIRECTDLTQQEISEYFGGRDRTAILYALKKTEDMVAKEPNLRKTVNNIIKNAKEQ